MEQPVDSQYLLTRLFSLAPLKTRGRPPYVYLEPQLVDAVEDQLVLLEPLVRTALPCSQRTLLYDTRVRKRGRLVARVVLRANGLQPVTERCRKDGRFSTRWRLGPLTNRYLQYLWPELDKVSPARPQSADDRSPADCLPRL